jgi:hypothetical protein
VCLIEEFGGRPIRAGESFSAAFIVGFFDTVEEMHSVYDEHAGAIGVGVNERGWRLELCCCSVWQGKNQHPMNGSNDPATCVDVSGWAIAANTDFVFGAG